MPAASPPSGTTEVDGVALTLLLDQAAVRPAGTLAVRASARNERATEVVWRSNGCSLVSPVTIHLVGQGAPAAGPVEPRLDGPLLALHERLTEGADEPGPMATRNGPGSGSAGSCTIDHGFSELAPGAMLSYEAAWSARTARGAPAIPGEYAARAEFTMLRPGVPLVPAAYRAERDGLPLLVELTIRVAVPEGGAAGLSAAAAASRLLAHPQIAQQVSQPGAAASASLRYEAGTWVLRMRAGPNATLVVMVADRADAAPTVRVESLPAP